MSEASEHLSRAAHAVRTAVLLLKMEMPTIQAFLKESRDMDNFGHITDPTLWRSSERRAADAIVSPLFKAAVALVAVHDEHLAKARDALERVRG